MNQFLDTKIVQNLELLCSIVTNVNLAYEMLGYIDVVLLLKLKFDGRLFLNIDLCDSPNCSEYNRLLSRNAKSTN